MRSVLTCSFFLAVALPLSAAEPMYPETPEAFSSFGAAVSEGFVYVYGGHTAPTHTYSTEAVTGKFRRLDLKNPAAGWEELPSGPGLQGLALVAHKGKLYRIGGMQPRNRPDEKADNHSTADVAVFDPKKKTWSPFVGLPAGRSSHDAVVVGDQIVVVGGWRMSGRDGASVYHDTALVLDLAQPKPAWTETKQPFRRRALNAAAVGDRVFVVGGMNADNDVERRVDVLDLKSLTWSAGPELPEPDKNGFTPAACAAEGAVYASPPNGKVYRLAADFASWIEIGQLDGKRLVHRIVPAAADRLLVLGGASRDGNIRRVESVSTRPTP